MKASFDRFIHNSTIWICQQSASVFCPWIKNNKNTHDYTFYTYNFLSNSLRLWCHDVRLVITLKVYNCLFLLDKLVGRSLKVSPPGTDTFRPNKVRFNKVPKSANPYFTSQKSLFSLMLCSGTGHFIPIGMICSMCLKKSLYFLWTSCSLSVSLDPEIFGSGASGWPRFPSWSWTLWREWYAT